MDTIEKRVGFLESLENSDNDRARANDYLQNLNIPLRRKVVLACDCSKLNFLKDEEGLSFEFANPEQPLTQEYVNSLYRDLYRLLERHQTKAGDKPFHIVIGWSHTDRSALLIAALVVHIAKRLGIDQLGVELHTGEEIRQEERGVTLLNFETILQQAQEIGNFDDVFFPEKNEGHSRMPGHLRKNEENILVQACRLGMKPFSNDPDGKKTYQNLSQENEFSVREKATHALLDQKARGKHSLVSIHGQAHLQGLADKLNPESDCQETLFIGASQMKGLYKDKDFYLPASPELANSPSLQEALAEKDRFPRMVHVLLPTESVEAKAKKEGWQASRFAFRMAEIADLEIGVELQNDLESIFEKLHSLSINDFKSIQNIFNRLPYFERRELLDACDTFPPPCFNPDLQKISIKIDLEDEKGDISDAEVSNIYLILHRLIKSQSERAKKENRPFHLLIAQEPFDRKGLLMSAMIMRIARWEGITLLGVERFPEGEIKLDANRTVPGLDKLWDVITAANARSLRTPEHYKIHDYVGLSLKPPNSLGDYYEELYKESDGSVTELKWLNKFPYLKWPDKLPYLSEFDNKHTRNNLDFQLDLAKDLGMEVFSTDPKGKRYLENPNPDTTSLRYEAMGKVLQKKAKDGESLVSIHRREHIPDVVKKLEQLSDKPPVTLCIDVTHFRNLPARQPSSSFWQNTPFLQRNLEKDNPKTVQAIFPGDIKRNAREAQLEPGVFALKKANDIEFGTEKSLSHSEIVARNRLRRAMRPLSTLTLQAV